MAFDTQPATMAPMMHPNKALETVHPDKLLRAVSDRCCGSMKFASIDVTAPEMTAVSYPNNNPPRVATNVNPVTNEALFCLMVYSPSRRTIFEQFSQPACKSW
jgi:hypothetical protein